MLAPQVGFEPTTRSLHVAPNFQMGVDYIFTLVGISVSSLYGAHAAQSALRGSLGIGLVFRH